MLKTASRFLVSLALAASPSLAQTTSGQPSAAPAGHWEGKIDVPDHPMSMTMDVAKDSKGAWIGTMTVVGTSSVDVPLSPLTVDASAVRFGARLPEEADFAGHLANGSINGTATNTQGSAPFQLTRSGDAKLNLPAPSSALTKDFAGEWLGTTEIQGKTIHLGLKLASAPDGTATATLISVDQGNTEVPIHTVTIHDKSLAFESRSVSGKFNGTLGADGAITGDWVQGQRTLPLTFRRAGTDAAKPTH